MKTEVEIQFGIGAVLVGLVAGVGYVVLIVLLNRKYQTLDTWASLIRRWAFLFVPTVPTFTTYFVVCGSLSALTAVVHGALSHEPQNIPNELTQSLCHGVEFLCSFILPLLYFKILEKLRLAHSWSLILTAMHMLTAGYRDAKLLLDQHETGPEIVSRFGVVDAFVPLAAYFFFYFIWPKLRRRETAGAALPR
jgi:hypothetical protein